MIEAMNFMQLPQRQQNAYYWKPPWTYIHPHAHEFEIRKENQNNGLFVCSATNGILLSTNTKTGFVSMCHACIFLNMWARLIMPRTGLRMKIRMRGSQTRITFAFYWMSSHKLDRFLHSLS